MPYKLLIKRQAQRKLQSLTRSERNRITEKIMILSENFEDLSLDVKPLEGQLYYRLRVGNWRIIFDRNEGLKIISIEKIKSRGDAYK
jgi:mRNA interferase RelE/StbE